jgi:hypothetical protein
LKSHRHCEERSDKAIQRAETQHWIASLRSQWRQNELIYVYNYASRAAAIR